jgi:hypothetical protein
MAQTVLRSLLSQAKPHRSDGLASFHGEPGTLAFDGAPPAAFGPDGMVRIELSLVPGQGGTRLLVKVTSLADKSRSRQAVVGEGLENLQFAYLDSSEKRPAWLAFWRDRDRLPDAVRLEWSGRTSATTWSSFVVRLPIAQDADCNFDPVSAECRKS